ncbi:MAG: hypothetical protein RMM31_03695 [Anaerolineae bacterium]|nr:hypothetical protein [Anaerolineae bacterium]
MRKIALGGLALLCAYLLIGVAFGIGWKVEAQYCRERREARGEFVDPEVGGVLGIAFSAFYWPVYTWANLYHTGEVFATPCDR